MNKLLKFLLFLLVIAAAAAYFLSKDFDKKNDIIYFGGDIITMKDSTDIAEAVYIKDGKIVEVGSKEAIFNLKTANTQVIDLQGKTLMPGFFDPHGHFDFAAVFYDMVDISGVKYRKAEDVWRIVEEKSKNGKKGEWIFFYGLDPILTKGINTPTIQYLDSIALDKPIVLITKALHVFYANSQAFAALGINEKTPNPSEASYYEKDANGKLTGGIVEQAALEPFRLKIQEGLKKSFAVNTQNILTDYAKSGVTSAVNMGLSNMNKNILGLYEHLASAQSTPFFKALQLIGKVPKRKASPRLFFYFRKEYDSFLPEKVANGDDFFKIIGIKLWYDGSPYSGSMFLRSPYMRSNFTINGIHLNPNHTSESLLKPEELYSLIEKYQSKGWQVAVHAQGDIANQEVIEAFEKLHQKSPLNNYRHRVEHCMLLPQNYIESMKKMTVSPSFHINHLLYYGDFLKSDVIGDERAELIFPIQSTVKQGIPYSLHADMPMFEASPLSLISTSINRKTEAGLLINGNERVSVYQGLRSMTLDAAWQLHMEDKLGSIEKGKYADLIVLDKNPLKIPKEDISSIKVLKTMVAGNTVWAEGQ